MVSRSEFRRKASMANKRIKRMQAQGIESPAYKTVMKTGGSFSAKGLSGKDFERENRRLDKFLESKTSTSRGAKKVYRDTIKRTGLDKLGIDKQYNKHSKKDMNDFFDTASKVHEYMRSQKGVYLTSGEVWGSIVSAFKKGGRHASLKSIISQVQKDYVSNRTGGGFPEF